jgi:hypothetical protein
LAVWSWSSTGLGIVADGDRDQGCEVHVFRRGRFVGAVGERILDLRGHQPPRQIGPPMLVFGVHHLHHPLTRSIKAQPCREPPRPADGAGK